MYYMMHVSNVSNIKLCSTIDRSRTWILAVEPVTKDKSSAKCYSIVITTT